MLVEEIISPIVMDVFRNWIWDLIVSLYNWIDIYFSSIVQIGVINIFEDSVISTISTRVYTLVGVFMLFRMSLVLIKYVTDPNAKEFDKGFGKIFMRLFAVVILVVAAPSFFSMMKKVQNNIIVFLPELFVVSGVSGDASFTAETLCEYTVTVDGVKHTATIPSGNKTCESVLEIPGLEDATLNNLSVDISVTDYYEHILSRNINKTFMYPIFNTGSTERLDQVIKDGDYNTITVYISERYPVTGEQITGDEADAGITKDLYVIRFDWILALLVTILSFAMIVVALFSLVVRSLKLAFLQILAPIPIIAYLNPGVDWNDGVSVTSKYLRAYFITYIDIFVRMSVVIIVMMGIDLVDNMTVYEYDSVVKLFLLESLLAALVIIPKIFGDIFAKDGVKLLDAVSIKSVAAGVSMGGGSSTTVSGGSTSTTNNSGVGGSSLDAVGNQIARDSMENNKAKNLTSTMSAGQYSTGSVEKNSLSSGAGLRTNTNFDTASTKATTDVSFGGVGGAVPTMNQGTPNVVVNTQGAGYTQKKDVTPYKSRGDASKGSPKTTESGRAMFQKTVNNYNNSTTNNYNYEGEANQPQKGNEQPKG